MSRKRDKAKEQKAELARQLGVKVGELDAASDALRAHARVCAPKLKANLEVSRAGLGLLRRPGPLALHLALYVVDAAGPRLARQQLLVGSVKKRPGPATLSSVMGGAQDRVRYTRPAHFLLLIVVTEGAEVSEAQEHAASLSDPRQLTLEVTLEGQQERHEVGDAVWAAARFESPRDALPLVDGAALVAPALAASVVSLPGVHRSKEELTLRVSRERLETTVFVDLRL